MSNTFVFYTLTCEIYRILTINGQQDGELMLYSYRKSAKGMPQKIWPQFRSAPALYQSLNLPAIGYKC